MIIRRVWYLKVMFLWQFVDKINNFLLVIKCQTELFSCRHIMEKKQELFSEDIRMREMLSNNYNKYLDLSNALVGKCLAWPTYLTFLLSDIFMYILDSWYIEQLITLKCTKSKMWLPVFDKIISEQCNKEI